MRIKINATALETEVLDTKGERVFYAKLDNVVYDADVELFLEEIKRVAYKANEL